MQKPRRNYEIRSKNQFRHISTKGAAILGVFPTIICYMRSDWFRNQPKKLMANHKACFISPEFPDLIYRRTGESRDLPNTLKIEIGTIENSRTQPEISNDLDFVCVNTEKPGYVFFFLSDV